MPGKSLSARKSKPSLTYAAMTGAMSAGMSYPFIVSQSASAVGSVERELDGVVGAHDRLRDDRDPAAARPRAAGRCAEKPALEPLPFPGSRT